MIFSSGPSSEVKKNAKAYLESMIAKKTLPQEPMSGQTLLLEGQGSRKIAHMVKECSKKNYARKQQQTRNEDPSKASPTVIDKNLDKVVKPNTPSSGVLEIEMGEG